MSGADDIRRADSNPPRIESQFYSGEASLLAEFSLCFMFLTICSLLGWFTIPCLLTIDFLNDIALTLDDILALLLQSIIIVNSTNPNETRMVTKILKIKTYESLI